MTRLSIWATAALLALLLSASHLLDGPTDAQAAADMAADVQDAIHAAQVAAK